MRKSVFAIGTAAALAACGQSDSGSTSNNVAANAVATAAKATPAYCFFKDAETKDWKASVDKTGNVTVRGTAYRQDSRYKAALAPAVVSGDTAEVAPTIGVNDTGFAARDDWWDVEEIIPASQGVKTVTVRCGDKTLATLDVPRKG